MSTNVTQQSGRKDTPRLRHLKSPSRLFRRLTTRFKPQSLRLKQVDVETASPPRSPTQRKPSTRRSAVPAASPDVAAVKRRQAALQQCGLVPLPRKDLSQLEAELDRRFTRIVVLPQDQQSQAELTSAERIRREWQAKNEGQPEKRGDDPDPKDLNAHSLDHERLVEPNPLSSSKSSASLPPIPETEVPEQDVISSENENETSSAPFPEAVDPLTVPLPDSPLSSSADLPDLPPTPPSKENKRLPPIVVNLTDNDAKETQDQVTRGRSLNRDSPPSLASKPSLPALSPTMTASSSSSISTPRDDDSRERMEAAITRSISAKSRSSRFEKLAHFRHRSEDLGVVHETIPESPELAVTESRTWNPNTESKAATDSAAFGEFAEKKQRRRISTGFFQSTKRNSGSIRSSSRSTSSDLSSMWSAIANDFSFKSLDGAKSRGSALSMTEKIQPQAANQAKITRSKSVMTSLGFKMTRKTTQPVKANYITPSSSAPMRRPTVRIVENRESLIQDVRKIEDDESRRLTEMAFMDF